jgi:hypothetical protein
MRAYSQGAGFTMQDLIALLQSISSLICPSSAAPSAKRSRAIFSILFQF